MFLIASVLVPATALAAGTGTLSLSSSSISLSAGSTFFVDVNAQATVALEGASTSLDFDVSKLQVVSVTKPAAGTGWNVAGVNYVLPTAAQIATANSTGHLSNIAAFFTDGTSNLPANTSLTVVRVTYLATASTSPTTSINLPTSGADPAALLDGTTGSGYGSPVGTSATGATVTISAGSGSGSSVTTTVTGSVDAGFVALSCPPAITVPLVRNVNNAADFTCTVGSNTTWTLSVVDQNADPATHGYMRDVTQGIKLHDSAFVHYNKHLDASNNVVYDTDVNLAANASAQTLALGQNNVAAPLTFTQQAEANDVAGSYSISLRFAVVSTF
jgi:hypothetical protein